jgi:hypothetical protein
MTPDVGRYRLMIVDYFDELRNEIDLCIEKQLIECYENDEEVDLLNKRRDVQLSEVADIEAANLKHLDELDDLAVDQLLFEDADSVRVKLFKTFCFVIDYNELMRLVIIDSCFSKEQILLFKETARFINQITGYLMEKSVLDKLFAFTSTVIDFLDLKYFFGY